MRTLANSEDLDEIEHFIRVYAARYDKKGSSEKEIQFIRKL